MDVSVLAVQAAGGFLTGAIIGYALRKVGKLLLIFIGVLLLPIFGLWSVGVIAVNWDAVNLWIGKLAEYLGIVLTDAVTALSSASAFGVAMVFGFLTGFSSFFRHVFIAPERPKKFVQKKR